MTPAERAANRRLACERLPVEHVIRFIKIFRILKGTYRHRRRRFQLRLTLLCALYNHPSSSKMTFAGGLINNLIDHHQGAGPISHKHGKKQVKSPE
ncbi:transposase family protein [Deinococcus cavernae]|uniref:transposase family protein n=1 Tax=Deinococcus cavernae TaxID=2320857 RepID=UPI001314FCA0